MAAELLTGYAESTGLDLTQLKGSLAVDPFAGAIRSGAAATSWSEVWDGQAQWLLTNSDYVAVIEGHADEQGTREYNLALGARRANAVREYLISKGIPASRIRTVSYGKERPIATCADEACYSQNRRAVTVISIGSLS